MNNLKLKVFNLKNNFLYFQRRLADLIKQILDPKIGIPIIIAICIRLLIAPYTEQRWDMYNWRLYPALLIGYRKNPFWLVDEGFYSWGYPALWLINCLISYKVYSLFWPIKYPENSASLWGGWNFTSVSQISGNINVFESYREFIPHKLPYLDLFLKSPIILADILIGISIYFIIKKYSNELSAKTYMYSWLFNPLVIFISSIWGMFDLLPIFFVILSFYFLYNKNNLLSSIFLSIGICYKLYPILLLPIYTTIIYKRDKNYFKSINYFIKTGITSFLIIFSSFYITALLTNMEPLNLSFHLMSNLIIKRSSPDWMGKNMFTGLTPLIILNNILSYNYNVPISPILMASSILILSFIIYFNNKKIQFSYLLSYTIIPHYIIYLTYATIHVPHLLWVMPFLFILSAKTKNSNYINQIWLLTFIGLIGIILKYDLSYFISPFFIWKEKNIRIPTIFNSSSNLLSYPIEFIFLFSYTYIYGIKSAIKETGR